MPLKIAIIGAGPAGLTLATLLHRANTPCRLYESEANAIQRDQGGTIDLHPRGGQLALAEAGLLEEFKRVSRPEGDTDRLVKSDGTLILDEARELEGKVKPEDLIKPEIDRVELRRMLLGSLPEETIVWGRKVVEVVESQEGRYDVVFADGAETGFDLVVGADGAWSKVRNILTDVKPYYSSVTAVELWAREVDEKHSWLAEYVGVGSMFMFDEGRAIICQRSGNNSIRAYACVRQPESWSKDCGIDWLKPEVARKSLVDGYFADCGDDLKRCILDSTENLVVRPLYMLPVDMRWEHHSGITVIGDAAHLMTPFAGVGVNVAMVDSLELAKAIIAAKDDKELLGAKLAEFEKAMFDRSNKFAQRTWDGLEQHFRGSGCDERAARFRKQVAALAQKPS